MRWLVVLALLVAGCSAEPVSFHGSQASGARTEPTPTQPEGIPPESTPAPSPVAGLPSASASSYAVLVDLFAGSGAYDIAVVSSSGAVAARAHPKQRSAISDALELPYVSASNSRVYYLDGDGDVRYLKADGTTGRTAAVPASPTVHAAFAVTPDDRRIAVALLDYSTTPVKLTLYVEDVGGAHHRVIFTSTNHYVWPVAWHAGQLVVAYLGPNAVPFKSKAVLYGNGDLIRYPYGPSPYGGINFHVINPTTAVRQAIISGGGASGLLSRSGVAVVQGDADNWQGQWMPWNSPADYGSYSAAGSLSPDGTVIAACCDQPGGAGRLVLWYPGGSSTALPVLAVSTDWVGWFDNSHLITGFYQRNDGTPAVLDINSMVVSAVNAHGIVAAMLPGGLD
jgi:hypothetical protein